MSLFNELEASVLSICGQKRRQVHSLSSAHRGSLALDDYVDRTCDGAAVSTKPH